MDTIILYTTYIIIELYARQTSYLKADAVVTRGW